MEIHAVAPAPRKYTYTKKITLKDGTIKTHTYEQEYTPKTNILQNADKGKIKRRFDACKDRATVQAISDLLTNAGY